MKRFILFILITLLAVPAALNAQTINDAARLSLPGISPSSRALGMGNSYIGLSDDAAAASFNPAGMALVKRMEFSGSLEFQDFSNTTSFYGTSTEYDNNTTRLSNFSFVFPFPTIRGSLSMGISYQRQNSFTGAMKFKGFNNTNTSFIQSILGTGVPFDLYLTDENRNTGINGNLQQSGDIIEDGSVGAWGFSGAVEIQKNLFIGGTLNILSGRYENSRDYYETDVNNIYNTTPLAPGYGWTSDFVEFNYNTLIDWNLSGWDAKAGLLYQAPFVRVGATVQFPRFYSIEEQFIVNGTTSWGGNNPDVALDSDYYSDKVEYNIRTPFSFEAGAAFKYRFVILSLSGRFTDYSQIEFDNPDGISLEYIDDLNRNINDFFGSVFDYNIGAEFTVPYTGLRLRAGYFVVHSPYKDDPSDYDRKYLTGGIGYLVDGTISLDLAFARGMWDNFGDNYGSGESRTYQEISQNTFQFTFSTRF